ncbi:hypothetical protein T4B_14812 [Trichinella pseudospiralis]|uniref:Uncharacterized protein n=1 Tax=Trichinella pseudospiralis TaxID=6337 RepID=A0A0V1GA16_TRIPS|nr:hypothetical protein T4B_14812 [Trichinella pseudospiralis]
MKSLKAIYSRTTEYPNFEKKFFGHFWQNKPIYSSEKFENFEN